MEEADWASLQATFIPLMLGFGIEPPHEDEDGGLDTLDVYRALVQLRSRLVNHAVGYEHETNTGRLLQGVDDPDTEIWLAELNPKKKNNPLREGDRTAIEAYLKGDYEEAPTLDKFFSGDEQDGDYDYPSSSQEYRPDTVGALFPREGKLKQPDTWDPEARIPEALNEYAFVTRVGTPEAPEDPKLGTQPLSSADSIDYLVNAMGLSLDEAKRVLAEMKRSAEGRRSRTGQRTAMQPSSAMCKLYRSRKLPYEPLSGIVEKAGNKSAVVLMGPVNKDGVPLEPRPRVMSWRRGVHMDCDIVADNPKLLFAALSRALQSALFWVAEKPGRKKSNKIYVGTVGQQGLYNVWSPGEPLTLQQIAENLKKAKSGGFSVTVSSCTQRRRRIRQRLARHFWGAAASGCDQDTGQEAG